MDRLLTGITLIGASLQTAWAVLSEGHWLALPLTLAMLWYGGSYARRGAREWLHRPLPGRQVLRLPGKP